MALAPAAQDADGLGEKKEKRGGGKREKERLARFEPRALRRRAREGGGERGDALKPARILKTQIVGWR